MQDKETERNYSGQINFRVKEQLKYDFVKLCRKSNNINMSAALTAYMQACVDADAILGQDLPAPLATKQDERLAELEAKVAEFAARFEALETAIANPQQEANQPGKYRVRAA